MISDIIRAFVWLLTFLAVIVIWLLWGMAGPRLSEIFLYQGFQTLAESFAPPLDSLAQTSDVMAKAGQWGDGFGALNALFAGLAFTGALAALFMQGQAVKRQNKDFHRQRFESSYFELLSLLREARREVRFAYSAAYRSAHGISPSSPKARIQTDADAFRTAMLEMRHLIRSKATATAHVRTQLEQNYRLGIHNRFESTFGPYFRIIYTILKRIQDDKVLTKKEKVQYANLLRSQLTSHEVSLAGFNGLMAQANDLSALLTEFHMLKYLPKTFVRTALKQVYDEQAFTPRND